MNEPIDYPEENERPKEIGQQVTKSVAQTLALTLAPVAISVFIYFTQFEEMKGEIKYLHGEIEQLRAAQAEDLREMKAMQMIIDNLPPIHYQDKIEIQFNAMFQNQSRIRKYVERNLDRLNTHTH